MSGCRSAYCLVVAFVACVDTSGATEKIPGDLWETTIQMSMEGMESMAMPPMTNRSCQKKDAEWTEPPGAKQDDTCEAVDWKVSGSTATWSIRCKDGSSGTGEMVFDGKEAYRGTMHIKSSEGAMSMKLSGRRVGDCDAGENQRKMAAYERQAKQAEAAQADAIAARCRQAAESVEIDLFLPPYSTCGSPEDKATLCSAVRTEKGFSSVAGRPPYQNPQLGKASELCGFEPEDVRNKLCGEALPRRSYKFLADHCPEAKKELAEAECAGRKFTSIPDEDLRGFCMAYAGESMTAENPPAEPTPADLKKETSSKGKKFLKGLLGR